MSGEAQATAPGANDQTHPNPPSSENHPSAESSSIAASSTTLESGPEISEAMKDIATLVLIYTHQIQDLSDNACNGSYLHVRSNNQICDIHATLGEALNYLQQGSGDTEGAINCLTTLQTSLVGWLDEWKKDFKELHRQYRTILPLRRPSMITNPDGVTFVPEAYREVFDPVLEDEGPELEHIGVIYFDGEPRMTTSPGRIRWAVCKRTLDENSQ